jgi:hypothetical protein
VTENGVGAVACNESPDVQLISAPLVRQAKLGASEGVKCPRGNCVSDRVRVNHPPIPSAAIVEEVEGHRTKQLKRTQGTMQPARETALPQA